ncbi:hypothetical protein ABZS66_61390 [Dactylosporangium sp. NPDC005572]|uniref:hypothetical protein n=1 Tax=Dactylosporangium sp. NPDC005572 TaxID=3156889 RepID=UPI0033B320DC
MIPPTPPPQPYSQARRRLQTHPVFAGEIPTEHSRSLPLPTRRFGRPAYAGFAGPAQRRPGQPLRLATPDRWWAVGAADQALLVYAQAPAVPFPGELADGPVEVSNGRSIAAAREDLAVLDELLDAAAPRFFAGEAADPPTRSALREQLAAVAGAGTLPWYRALVPDFFAWLEG